jgi:hypothetical protein
VDDVGRKLCRDDHGGELWEDRLARRVEAEEEVWHEDRDEPRERIPETRRHMF